MKLLNSHGENAVHGVLSMIIQVKHLMLPNYLCHTHTSSDTLGNHAASFSSSFNVAAWPLKVTLPGKQTKLFGHNDAWRCLWRADSSVGREMGVAKTQPCGQKSKLEPKRARQVAFLLCKLLARLPGSCLERERGKLLLNCPVCVCA